MKNKLFIIPFLIFIFVFGFNNKVEAYSESEYYYFNDMDEDSTQYYSLKSEVDYYLINEDNVNLQNYLNTSKTNILYNKFRNGDYSNYGKYAIIIMHQGTIPKLYIFNSLDDIYVSKNSGTINVYLKNCTRIYGKTSTGEQNSISTSTNESIITFNLTSDLNVYQYMYYYLELQYNLIHFTYVSDKEIYNKIFKNGYNPIPNISFDLKEEIKDSNDNIIGKILQTNISQLDHLKYNYYYRINENDWNLIESTNFVINSFYYELKENGTFYFKIEDKENNYINSSTFTTNGIDSFGSLESEDVEYEYINENGVKTTYNKLLKIPISSFYDFEYNSFKKFEFTFLSRSKENNTSDFLIKYHNKENSNGIDIPLHIKFYENIEDITKTSGGGGGHSFGSENLVVNDCKIHNLPFNYSIHNDNTNYYNVLQLIPTNCTNNFNYSLSDFRNDYIYVYYNARIYKNSASIKEDYEKNKDNYENDSPKSFLNSVSQALTYFLKPIKEIFKLVTYFFNSLPFQIRYMFMAVFVIGIILIVFKLFF